MKKTEIRRGDIFSYDFGTRICSIQSGVRPVLVIQADNFNANALTVIVASITSCLLYTSPVIMMWIPSIINADMNFDLRGIPITPENNFFIQGFMGMVWSVSYTHLDVYKRQAFDIP